MYIYKHVHIYIYIYIGLTRNRRTRAAEARLAAHQAQPNPRGMRVHGCGHARTHPEPNFQGHGGNGCSLRFMFSLYVVLSMYCKYLYKLKSPIVCMYVCKDSAAPAPLSI